MEDGGTIQVAPPDTCAQQTPELKNFDLSLEPLRTEGADSLLPDPAGDILAAKLTLLVTASCSGFRHITTIASDDVFQYTDADGKRENPIRPGDRIIRVILSFLFRDSLIPHTVELSPPGGMTFEHPGDQPRITSFLKHHRFLNLLFIILALAGALLPDLDDDDDDDDSDNHHHIHHLFQPA